MFPSQEIELAVTLTAGSGGERAGGGGRAGHPPARALQGRGQGLTFVHFSAQRKRFLWDRGVFRGCLGGVRWYQGVFVCQKRLRLS